MNENTHVIVQDIFYCDQNNNQGKSKRYMDI